ncbi:MAG: gamma-glutamyl-gamma-aminobutyrate hydrolase family protein [Gemmataceae bacterium]|nr:gamma-glutamyl-gamma-aminobutyrate hydrolase family protein [Gemmataceae bacterium]MDW8243874.1 gamma-glutamyl-gamma-aminobutyrate hydrolase family protein [Thermogemmata sp.]
MPTVRAKESKIGVASHASSRPLIGVNVDVIIERGTTPHLRLNLGYLDAIWAAGGMPVLIPPLRKDSLTELNPLLERLAGIVLTGGGDMDPRRNGQSLTAAVHPMPERREEVDRYLLAWIFERKLPVLGIGVGMQQLNVFAGGTLFLHLPHDNPRAMPHYDHSGAPHRHMVLIEPNTRLQDIYGTPELRVNSMHHQAVHQLGRRMRVAARAPDGVVEAIESTDPNWFCVGVQWHPEDETASALDMQIFECFVQAAAKTSVPLSVAA